jgi:hypothetical protein
MPPKRMTKQKGAGLIDSAKKLLSKAHDFAKKEKLLSKALNSFGYKKAAAHARMAGYGRVRRVRKA